ncbi:MAG: hypothetical protein ACP5GL_06480 [Infirmifilum sp.]
MGRKLDSLVHGTALEKFHMPPLSLAWNNLIFYTGQTFEPLHVSNLPGSPRTIGLEAMRPLKVQALMMVS